MGEFTKEQGDKPPKKRKEPSRENRIFVVGEEEFAKNV